MHTMRQGTSIRLCRVADDVFLFLSERSAMFVYGTVYTFIFTKHFRYLYISYMDTAYVREHPPPGLWLGRCCCWSLG